MSGKNRSMKLKNNYQTLKKTPYDQMLIVLKCLLVGLAAGGISVLYRLILGKSETFAFWMYAKVRADWMLLIPLLCCFLIAALLIGKMVDANPMISGSGIPQIEGILKGYFLKRKGWFSTLVYKFLSGAIGIAGGLSLGREGPSIQLGACMGEAIGNQISSGRLEKKILIAGGASAGLAAAFNAPLAGVIFALEEIFKYLNPVILLSMMSAAVSSDFISKQVFGLEPIFRFDVPGPIPLDQYGWLIPLGLLLGVLGAFYNFILLKIKSGYQSLKGWKTWMKILFPFGVAAVLGMTLPEVLGGGHRMIEEYTPELILGFLILLLVVKFFFSLLCFGSGIPGGIFFPLIILGAGIGAAFAKTVIVYFHVDPSLFQNFVILAMAGYFTAIVRAPITGIILVTEMTNSFSHLLSLTIVSVIAYIVAYLLKSPPVYDALLNDLIAGTKQESEESGKRIVFEFVIQHESELANQKIRDLKLPEGILFVELRRGEDRIMPNGDTILEVGDLLTVLTDVNLESRVKQELKVE